MVSLFDSSFYVLSITLLLYLSGFLHVDTVD